MQGYQRECTSIWCRDLCPLEAKAFCILNGLDHTAFYVNYIDQELYRVTIMPADYYYRPKEWHTQDSMHFICKISLAG